MLKKFLLKERNYFNCVLWKENNPEKITWIITSNIIPQPSAVVRTSSLFTLHFAEAIFPCFPCFPCFLCDTDFSLFTIHFSLRRRRPHPSSIMSEVSEAIQAKCLAFGDRVIKLNDYLLTKAANVKPTYKMVGGKRVYEKSIPVYLQSVANLSNQLLRAGTSIGANNAEASSAISRADFKSKSYIALKEARESLYWLDLLHRNNYLDDKQFNSIYADCEELVKILVNRCKKLDENM